MVLRTKILLRLIICATLALAAASCRHAPDETQVRAAIASAAQGAQSTEASAVAAVLSADFDGNDGVFDRQQLGNLVRFFRLRHKAVGVTVGPIAIERRGERLLAGFSVTLTGGESLVPEQAGVYRVETAWRREAGEWHCYVAHWQRSI